MGTQHHEISVAVQSFFVVCVCRFRTSWQADHGFLKYVTCIAFAISPPSMKDTKKNHITGAVGIPGDFNAKAFKQKLPTLPTANVEIFET